jgi:hypothetical protein
MINFMDDQELDRQLREAAPYIDDGGFTARVLQSLPRPEKAPARLRSAILIAMTVLASVLAYIGSGGIGFVNDILARATALPILWLLGVAFTAGIVIGTGGLVAALQKSREPGLIGR